MMRKFQETIGRARLALLAFWLARSGQEQRLLGVGGACAALALFYALLVAPAVAGRAQLRQDLPRLRQDAAEMRALAARAAQLARQAPAAPAAPLSRDGLSAALAAHGMKAQALAVTADAATLQLNGVPFAAVMAWLDALRRDSRVVVQQAGIVAQAAPGLVDASLTLRQNAAAP